MAIKSRLFSKEVEEGGCKGGGRRGRTREPKDVKGGRRKRVP